MTPYELVAKAKTSSQLTDLVLSQVSHAIYVVDQHYQFAFLNVFPPPFDTPQPYGTCCYDLLMGHSHPCAFCLIPTLLGAQQPPTSHVIQCGAQWYQLTLSRLLCDNGYPLCLHVLSSINARGPRLASMKDQGVAQAELAELEDLLGTTEEWLVIKRLIRELACFPTVTVLLVGETGTGKDLVAQALHTTTFGRDAPFIPLNCTAIPDALLESELFGYERGAFTGANQTKPGLFELVHGGTLFLDEIGQLSPTLQPKLLRVLETKRFTRLGGTREIAVHCRLCCATNTPLRDKTVTGAFREDLLHRLSTFVLTLPLLSERQDDLPLLVEAFLTEANQQLGKQVQGIAPEALARLQAYTWPGNLRELKNAIERAVILTAPGGRIEPTVLPPELDPPGAGEPPAILPLREVERRYVASVMGRCRGNKSQAARSLGIARNTLRKKLRDHQLSWSETDQ